VQLRDGLGAVSAIGAGINASFQNLRRAFDVLSKQGATVLGVSTSSFRISLLVEEGKCPRPSVACTRELVSEGRTRRVAPAIRFPAPDLRHQPLARQAEGDRPRGARLPRARAGPS
jgi:hypothetical protein